MPLQPTTWNAVVVGSWNRAILSPRGIATRLFGLEPGTPVDVRVPLDGLSPFQVIHDGLVVVAVDEKLIVEVQTPDFDHLARAAALARRAVEALQVTPFQAAGFNVRYKVEPFPAPTLELLTCPATDALTDAQFVLGPMVHKWSIEHAPGQINLAVRVADGPQGTIELNFHRGSGEVAALLEWLSMDATAVRASVVRILNALQLTI